MDGSNSFRNTGAFLACVMLMFVFSQSIFADDSVCAKVAIKISQDATLERQAFIATMRLSNGFPDLQIDNVQVDVKVTDESGVPTSVTSDPADESASFFLRIDGLDGVGAVDGTGTVEPLSVATMQWLMIPAPGAAGDLPTGKRYFVGAKLSYVINGELTEMSITPDFIVVRPMPRLKLDYFLPKHVYGDDAFSVEVEPIVPFTLGLLVRNSGYGIANNLKVESAQPQIEDNEQGLLIDFSIDGSEVNGQPAAESLLVDFGDIEGNGAGIARWVMSCTLSGKFTDFGASFTHDDALGGQLTSLIEETVSHTLVRDVLVDIAGRDSIRDFLADDGDGFRVYESTGVVTDVDDLTSFASLDGGVVEGSAVRHVLTVSNAAGFSYLKLDDPHGGTKTIRKVVRSDGKRINLHNVWLNRVRAQDDSWEYFFHLFDAGSTGSYTVIFDDAPAEPRAPVLAVIPNQTGFVGQLLSFVVTATDPDGPVPSLSAAPLPVGASFVDNSDGTGTFSWTPGVGQDGISLIAFIASDGSLTDEQLVSLNISDDPDSDNDGMPDLWELANFGSLDRDGTGDFDGDGVSDLDEYTNGSDPTTDDYVSQWATVQTTAGSEWQTVTLTDSHVSPVVIAGVPTALETSPGVVRIKDVGHNGFSVKFQEWEYYDGTHGAEEIGLLVVPSGRSTLADGTVVEAGTLSVSGTKSWTTHTFTSSFPGSPSLFLTVQSENGTEAVAIRATDVTSVGFELALFEQEASNNQHVSETVGYLAVYSVDGSVITTIDGVDKTIELKGHSLDDKWANMGIGAMRIEEEASADSETLHNSEDLSIMTIGNLVFAQDVSANEIDACSLRQSTVDNDSDELIDVWEVQSFGDLAQGSLDDFDQDGLINIEEWNLGTDPTEADSDGDGMPDGFEYNWFASFDRDGTGDFDNDGVPDLVEFENGTNPTVNDYVSYWASAVTTVTTDWSSISFPNAYVSPVVIAGIPTHADSDAGVVRVRNVGAKGFELQFAEWPYLDGEHGNESVPYLIVPSGRTVLGDGTVVEAGTIQLSGTGFTTFAFTGGFAGTPTLLLTVQSYSDAEPVSVRASDVTTAGFSAALVEQELSSDGHGQETVGYVAIYSTAGHGVTTVNGSDVGYQVSSNTLSHIWSKFGSVALQVEEEGSADSEETHAAETVSVMAVGSSLFAQSVSVNEADPFALRLSNADIDNDGLNDDWERQQLGDLTQSDSSDGDNDGLTNGQEYDLGTNPTAEDTDGDGMPDGFEYNWFATFDRDGTGDYDNDGVSDLDEFNNGTNPTLDDYVSYWATATTTVGGDWTTVSLPNAYVSPVVIAGTPSHFDDEPGVARVRNVSATNFEWRFQEWSYLDGNHSSESIPYLVMPKGRVILADGTFVEAGTYSLSGANTTMTTFTAPFAGAPIVLLTVQTSGDDEAVIVRASNVTNTGFLSSLGEQESLVDGHGTETVGYVAIYNVAGSGTANINGTDSAFQLLSQSVDGIWRKVSDMALLVEEESSADSETEHGFETLSLLMIGNAVFAQDVTSADSDTCGIRLSRADVDNDGLIDDWERQQLGDLSGSFADDGDNDGLSNGQEYDLGTNPSASDTDGDGMPDGYEFNWFATFDRDGTGDLDNDGVSDLDEYTNGTNPTIDDYVSYWATATTTVNSNWNRVDLPNAYVSPVVIVGPPSHLDDEPGVVRVNNVTATGFDVRFEEWSYLDGVHGNEQSPYLVMPTGRTTLADGTIVEAGKVELNGTQATNVSFSDGFAGVPTLLLTVQTAGDTETVAVKTTDITTIGFSVALVEQESLSDGHGTETVGYVAIFNSTGDGTTTVNGVTTAYQLTSTSVDGIWRKFGEAALQIEEEASLDAEVGHGYEELNLLLVDNHLFAQTVTSNESDAFAIRYSRADTDGDLLNDDWERQRLGDLASSGSDDNDLDGLTNTQEYELGTDPINSDTDGDGMPDGFEYNWFASFERDGTGDFDGDSVSDLDEYTNETNPTVDDYVSYWTAASTAVTTGWTSIVLPKAYVSPVVIVGPPTHTDDEPGVIRLRGVRAKGFDLQFAEWPYLDGIHSEENVPYLVVPAGRTTLADGTIVEAGTFQTTGTNFVDVSFSQGFTGLPTVLLTVQSYGDAEAVSVRTMDVTTSGFRASVSEQELSSDGHGQETVGYLAIYNVAGSGIANVNGSDSSFQTTSMTVDDVWKKLGTIALQIEEETSSDSEVTHSDESISLLTLGSHIFAQNQTVNEGDTFALRLSNADVDGDGLNDDWERQQLGDLNSSSTDDNDNDGLTNGQEYDLGINPGVADTDGDGMNDGFEYNWFASFDRDGTGDYDGDGVSDLDEYTNGTNPTVDDYVSYWATAITTVNSDWSTVALPNAYVSPVVIVGAPSYLDGEPGTIRVNKVKATGFDLRFEEWPYLDGIHGSEIVPYLVLPSGRTTLADGTVVEAGKFDLSDTDFSAVTFTDSFAGIPTVLLTVQTAGDTEPVAVRATDVTTAGFRATLTEQESSSDGHGTETVGYVAIHNVANAGTSVVNGTDTAFALSVAGVDSIWRKLATAALLIEEEESADSELNHPVEQLALLTIGENVFVQDVSTNDGDTTAIRISRADVDGDGLNDDWERQRLGDLASSASSDSDNDGLTNGQEYDLGTNPASADTDGDGMPDGFEFTWFGNFDRDGTGDFDGDGVTDFDEFTNGTNPTVDDYVSYWATATITVNSDWNKITLPNAYVSPVVIAGLPSYADGEPGAVRINNVKATGFDVRFEEWPYLDGTHGNETMPYLVLPAGRTTLSDGTVVEAGKVDLSATGFNTVTFSEGFDGIPTLLVTVQTANDSETVAVRATDVTSSDFKVALVEQEGSSDGHGVETIGYVAIFNAASVGTATINGTDAQFQLLKDSVDSIWHKFELAALLVEEETSADAERDHNFEELAIFKIGDAIFGLDVTSADSDPCALRLSRADIDGDNLNDDWERQRLGDLTHGASDDGDTDGLTNLQEYELGTNPAVADTDGDGMPDGFEFTWFGNFDRDGTGDFDGDGVTDLDEFINGTNPTVNDYVTYWASGRTNLTTSWQQVNLPNAYVAPVVIAGPPTHLDDEPGVIRVRNIGVKGFEVSFKEWPYLDGQHNNEEIPYLVVPAGRTTFSDGTVVEAGTFTVSGTDITNTTFSGTFAGTPTLLLTLQTANDTEPVAVRASDVTTVGFKTALVEQESSSDGHGAEIVGYLAVYNGTGSGMVNINGTDTYVQLTSTSVTDIWSKFGNIALQVEEELSADTEVTHSTESLSILTIGSSIFAQDVSSSDNDSCALRLSNADVDSDGLNDDWERQRLGDLTQGSSDDGDNDGLTNAQEYELGTNPTATDTDGDGMPDGFEYTWFGNFDRDGSDDYDNDGVSDLTEFINGTNPTVDDYVSSFASLVTTMSSDWLTITLPDARVEPVVIASLPTYKDSDAGVVRVQNIGVKGFEVSFGEWENEDGIHAEEEASLLVAPEGKYDLADGTSILVGKTPITGEGNWTTVNFSAAFSSTPVVFLTVQSSSRVLAVRSRNITTSSFEVALFGQEAGAIGEVGGVIGYMAIDGNETQATLPLDSGDTTVALSSASLNSDWRRVETMAIKIQEEQSADSEVSHANETVSLMTVGDYVFGQDGSNDLDPCSLRMSKADEDNDGMNDDWERQYFTDLSRDGSGDFDEDRISDLAEYLGVTNPVDADFIWYWTSRALQVGSDWTTVNLGENYVSPVVIAGVPTHSDGEAGVVRVNNVQANGFQTRFEEWDYLDGTHGLEAISFIVAPAGREVFADGTIAVAGTFVTSDEAEVIFTQPFAGKPTLLLTVQSANDVSTVSVRASEVTSTGFKARLLEQEASTDGHSAETIGYLALYNASGNGTAKVDGSDMAFSYETIELDSLWRKAAAGVMVVEEEQSADTEVLHPFETINHLVVGGHHFAQDISTQDIESCALRRSVIDSDNDGLFDEWELQYFGDLSQVASGDPDGDGLTNSQEFDAGSDPTVSEYVDYWTYGVLSVNSSWQNVVTENYAAPVVIAGIPTNNEPAPGVVSLRNVAKDGFQVKFAEWDYLDGIHGNEELPYLVAPTGRSTLADGTVCEVGTFELTASGQWVGHTFSNSFAGTPLVLLTVQSANESSPVVVRAKDVTTDGFSVAMFEEEGLTDGHGTEVIGYVAIYNATGAGELPVAEGTLGFTIGSRRVDWHWTKTGNVALLMQEEMSADIEVDHAYETVSLLTINGRLFGQETSTTDPDVCAVRMSSTDSDNDQLIDDWELQAFGQLGRDGTGDYDGDGLTDAQEYALSTNPILSDTDGDTMPDGWEITYGLDPHVNDGDGDLDNDGVTNSAEYFGGWDPTIPAPVILSLLADPSNGPKPLSVILTAQVTGVVTQWDWDFGDDETSSSPSPVNHVFNEVRTFQIVLAISGPGGPASAATSVSCGNVPPVACAGHDQTVKVDKPKKKGKGKKGKKNKDCREESDVEVALNGLNSYDIEDSILSYEWTQIGGPSVQLDGSQLAIAKFMAPIPDSRDGVVLTFLLMVTDSNGGTAMDTIDINVTWKNKAPVANAGSDVLAVSGLPANLDGSQSSDKESTQLSYHWAQLVGPTLLLDDTSSVTPSFVSTVAVDTSYVFELTVTDDGGLRDSSRVVVNVPVTGTPPTADAGRNQKVSEADTVTLDGTTSSDNGVEVTGYRWRQIEGPSITLSDVTTGKPTFVAPIVDCTKTLGFELEVIGATGLRTTDQVIVKVKDNGLNCLPRDYLHFRTYNRQKRMAIKALSDCGFVELDTQNPDEIGDTDGKPYGIDEYGLVYTRSKVATPGATFEVSYHLQSAVRSEYGWFSWTRANGWKSLGDGVEWDKKHQIATVSIVDGGRSDNDGVADGYVELISGPGAGCFIATAAHGSHLNPHVQILREFRNEFLLTSETGQWFVNKYYDYSPPIAGFILRNKAARFVTRLGLIPVIMFGWLALQIGALSAALLMLLLLLSLAIGSRKAYRMAFIQEESA